MRLLERNAIREINVDRIETSIPELYLRCTTLTEYRRVLGTIDDLGKKKNKDERHLMAEFIYEFLVDEEGNKFVDMQNLEDVMKLNHQLMTRIFTALSEKMNVPIKR